MLLYVCDMYKSYTNTMQKLYSQQSFCTSGKAIDIGASLEHLGSNFAYLRFMLDKIATPTANVSPTRANIASVT